MEFSLRDDMRVVTYKVVKVYLEKHSKVSAETAQNWQQYKKLRLYSKVIMKL